jgi:hypothetical protein
LIGPRLNRGVWGEGKQDIRAVLWSECGGAVGCDMMEIERTRTRKAVVKKEKKKHFKTHITQKRHAICFPLNEEKESFVFLFCFSLILCSFSLGEKKEE